MTDVAIVILYLGGLLVIHQSIKRLEDYLQPKIDRLRKR